MSAAPCSAPQKFSRTLSPGHGTKNPLQAGLSRNPLDAGSAKVNESTTRAIGISLEREYGSTTSRGRENVGGASKAGKREMLFFGEMLGSEENYWRKPEEWPYCAPVRAAYLGHFDGDF
jgi:hypothetical protein